MKHSYVSREQITQYIQHLNNDDHFKNMIINSNLKTQEAIYIAKILEDLFIKISLDAANNVVDDVKTAIIKLQENDKNDLNVLLEVLNNFKV